MERKPPMKREVVPTEEREYNYGTEYSSEVDDSPHQVGRRDLSDPKDISKAKGDIEKSSAV